MEDLKGEDDLEVSQDELNALLIELLGDEYDADPKNNEQVENEDGDADLITEVNNICFGVTFNFDL